MRRLIMLTILGAITLGVMSSSANAYGRYRYSYGYDRPRPFQALMEFERRKNAALGRMLGW